MMGIVLVVLTGLLQFSIVTGQCGYFKFYDGDREVTNISCSVFTTSDCNKGYSSFPNNLSVGASVAKPRDFEVREFRRNFTTPAKDVVKASGALFTWKPPLDSTSRRYTKGFYLRLMPVGSGKEKCRLIDLQGVDLTASTGFHFSIELFPFPVSEFETYLTYLTSLPPPSDEELEEGLKEQIVFTLQRTIYYSQESVVYPDDWTTWINLKLHRTKGTVEVTFGYPADDSLAEFTAFYVQIVRKDSSSPLHEEVVRKIGSETEGKYNFTNVPSGLFRVQIQPKDLYFNHGDRCQCWKPHPNFENKRECGTCRFSATEHFNFTSLVTSSPAESTSPDTSTGPGPGLATTPKTGSATTPKTGSSVDPGKSDPNTAVVAVAVVVPVIFVLFIVVLVVLGCLYKRGKFSISRGGRDQNENYRPSTKQCSTFVNVIDITETGKGGRDQNENYPPSAKQCSTFVNVIDITETGKEPRVPQLSRKKVLVLAAEDHECFTKAVERLADFLRVHCMCEVAFAPQQMPQLRKASNSYCWLSTQIDSSDFVIIVTSEAALQLFQAFRQGSGYPRAALGPEGDLFTPGIQHISGKIANSEDVRNIIRVWFNHTSPDYRLPITALPSFHYHLPEHLTPFLQHIHGLDKTMDLSKVNLPLKGNVEELEGGQEWLDAVQQAGKYEQLNPNWFHSKFGQPEELFQSHTKPGYDKQDSDDSGYTEPKHRLSSASGNTGGVVDEAEYGMDNTIFSRDDFYPPSICTDFTAYTVPFPSEDKPLEIDDQSVSEAFHRLNQQNDPELQQSLSRDLDGGSWGGCGASPCDPPADQALYLRQMGAGCVNFVPDDEDHDCISVSSAQSV